MTRTRHHSTFSRRSPGDVSGAWWLARLLLVLVVVLDFLSAPFHHHHHHDGIEEQIGFATGHAALDDSGKHVEGDEHSLGSHATLAIRIDPSRLAQLPPIDNGDAQIAFVSVAQRLAVVDELPPHHWRPDRSRPEVRSHRSLPPAGRAPPLHA